LDHFGDLRTEEKKKKTLKSGSETKLVCPKPRIEYYCVANQRK